MENTTNLKLPLLISNQSQKEITHNEALTIIDNILQNGIIDKDLITPPVSSNSNDLYIVGTSATDDWVGEDGHLAYYDNGWRFIEPREGTTFWVNDEDCLYTYDGSSWEKTLETISGTVQDLDDLSDVSITSASQYDLLQHNGTSFVNTDELQNLSLLGINTTADNTNKLIVKSDAVLFDNATDDSQIKVNKVTSTDTASHLFQTNYSGRAEFGLVGNDDFTLKVSNDGSTWNNSFVVDKSTGDIDFKGNITNNGNSIGGSSNVMPLPQTSDSAAVGYFYFLNTVYGQITLPATGTWMVWGMTRNGSGVIQSQWAGIYSGGSSVGIASYYNDGFALRIQ